MEAGQPPPGPGEPPPQSEEELRARLEEEMRRVRVQDLVLQSVASLVNLTARRIAKDDERDLEQARIGIEAVRGLVDVLEPEPRKQVQEALSELQVLYAQASGGGGEASEEKPVEERPSPPPPQPSGQQSGAKPPPKLWTPHQRD